MIFGSADKLVPASFLVIGATLVASMTEVPLTTNSSPLFRPPNLRLLSLPCVFPSDSKRVYF